MPVGLGTAITATLSAFSTLLIGAKTPVKQVTHIDPSLDRVTNHQFFRHIDSVHTAERTAAEIHAPANSIRQFKRNTQARREEASKLAKFKA